MFLENAKGGEVTVNLYDDNTVISTFTTEKNARFAIDAPIAKHYTVELVKEGFVTKRVIINTKQVYKSKERVEDFDFNVHLIHEEQEVDYSILDFPMALIEYKKSIKGFEYNKKYTRQMHKPQNKLIAEGFASLLALYYSVGLNSTSILRMWFVGSLVMRISSMVLVPLKSAVKISTIIRSELFFGMCFNSLVLTNLSSLII